MRATSFSAPARADKSLKIAVIFVSVFGAIELLAVALHYGARWRVTHQGSQPAAVVTPAVTTESTPAVATETASVASTTAPVAAAQGSPSNAALSAAERLLKEATLLRERGDTNNALARLQDAAQRDPKNANVLAEMAMIYESMQLLDRSNETWRKIEEIGPSAGALYELAEMKLRVGVGSSAAPATAGPGFAGVSPLDAGTTRNDPDGVPTGSTFGISEATVTQNPDPEADTNLTLRVAVKSRSNTILDHTKVKIQVYFYDTVDNNKIALTDAEVNYEWLTPNHDWKATNPEVLAVSYVRLKGGAISSEAALTEAAAAVTPPSGGKKPKPAKKGDAAEANRKYAGYQVRVYYNDQLQDVRAEPTKLLNLFPPPLTLSSP
ncbi:MAG: hypothetical protein M3Z22_08305 [Verrucomicrobiota bacterium]|nr:hypothetical protein [Verrucomicrobiota bacterium]